VPEAGSPHEAEVERRVVGVIFAHRPSLDLIFSSLEPTDFYDGRWRSIFKAAREVYLKNGIVDVALVIDALGDAYQPQAIDYALESGFRSANIRSYCESLRRYGEARYLQARASALSHAAASFSGSDIEDLQKLAAEVVSAIGSRTGDLEEAPLDEAVGSYLDRIFNPDKTPTIHTGLRDLDWKLSGGGLAVGTLTMLGARRGVGKTAVGLSIVDSALRQGKHVCWVSQEMTAEEVVGRLIVARSRVPVAGLRNFNDDERGDLIAAAAEVRSERLTIYDRPVAPERLWALCRRWKALGKLDLLGVDYLQIMRLDRGDDKEVQAIGDAVLTLKQIAKENRVPVLCLAQCRREADRLENKDPRIHMSHFKGSGAIEEHADHAILMWKPDSESRELQCELAKNRHGETGMFNVAANFHTMDFKCVLRSPPPGVSEAEAEQETPEPAGRVVEQQSLHGMKGAPDD